MNAILNAPIGLALLHLAVQIALIIRVLLRPHRGPSSRIAWIVVILAAPVVGIIAYLLLGETNVGRRRVERMRTVIGQMPSVTDAPGADDPDIRPNPTNRYEHLFRVATTINGFTPLGGNSARLMEDSNATIDSMVDDIDNATDHVHLIVYIWLTDNNGRKIAEALVRAAKRGVTCRAMADGLGSRDTIRSEVWRDMGDTGVKLATALPIGNPLIQSSW